MSKDVWSGNAARVDRTRRDLPSRTKAVTALVVHTTGSGIIGKALKANADPLDYAADYYARPKSYASHYLIGYDGTIVGTVPENLVAYHAGVGKGRRKLYAKGDDWRRFIAKGRELVDTGEPQGRYDDWVERWPGLTSPLELLDGPSVNGQTIGLDLLAPLPGERHPTTQIMWARALVIDLVDRYHLGTVAGSSVDELEIPKGVLLRHSDVDPITRSSKRGGWDCPAYALRALCAQLGVESWPELSQS